MDVTIGGGSVQITATQLTSSTPSAALPAISPRRVDFPPGDQVSGDGLADIRDDGCLESEIAYHNGDETTFSAEPWDRFQQPVIGSRFSNRILHAVYSTQKLRLRCNTGMLTPNRGLIRTGAAQMITLIQTVQRSAAVATLVVVLAAAPATATTTFTTSLNSLNQVPPQESSASGSGTLTLATDQNSFTILMSYTSLSSAIQGAHVHCCATAKGNAPIAVAFTVSNGPTTGIISGTITGTYDLTTASTYTADFLAAYGGTAAGARTAFLNGLGNGLAYLNVHSAAYPAGEIRGQLPSASGVGAGAVPEPASWALMITGFALVGGTMRRRTPRTMAC